MRSRRSKSLTGFSVRLFQRPPSVLRYLELSAGHEPWQLRLIASRSPRWVKSGNGVVVGFGNLTGALRIRLVEGGRYESDSEQQPPPSPRIKPGNIAYAAVFLASEEFRMITGHILPVDRGIGA
jgi:hypothetical protein